MSEQRQVECPKCEGQATETIFYGDTMHFGSMDMQPPETEVAIQIECDCGYFQEYKDWL